MLKRLIPVALFIALCGAAAAWAWPKFKSRAEALASARQTLQNIASAPRDVNTCIDEKRIRLLLSQLARIDAHSPYWLLSPLRGDPDATRDNALAVVDAGLRQTIIPDLACRLSQHALQLASSFNEDGAKEAPQFDPASLPGARISAYLRSIISLETNLVRFHRLEIYSSRDDSAQNLSDFYQLEEYAYGSPLPSSFRRTGGTLALAITDGRYGGGLHIPFDMQLRYAARLQRLSTNLRLQLNQEIDAGAALLAHMNGSRDTAKLYQWISWVDRSWLHSDAAHNPCETVRSALQEDINTLTSQYGYPESFTETLDAFDTDRCYRPLMARLGGMRLAPYGSVFIRDKDGSVQINPELSTQAKQ